LLGSALLTAAFFGLVLTPVALDDRVGFVGQAFARVDAGAELALVGFDLV
jgi:hypothetical protein